MALYRYEAEDKKGQIVMGAMHAKSEADVQSRLIQQGYRPTYITTPSSDSAVGAASVKSGQLASQTASKVKILSKATVKPATLALFYRQFASQLRAGISIYQTLANLAPQSQPPVLAQAVKHMKDVTYHGGRISDAMESYPNIFPPYVRGSVRAGETGGFIDVVLDEIAMEHERDAKFYKGSWLFTSLIVQEVLAIALVQPVIISFFPSANSNSYNINNHIHKYLILAFARNTPIAIFLMLCVVWAARWFKRSRFAVYHDSLLMKIPVFGNLERQRSLATFIRMLRRLYVAGLGPIVAWEGAMHSARNSVIREKLMEAGEKVRNNVPIHEAFISTHLFANEMEQTLATGVVSGQVVDALDQVAQYYEDNVDRAFTSSRMALLHIGLTSFIILVGVVVIMLTKSYFGAIFSPKMWWNQN